MNNNNWERKYRSLLSKFRNAVDLAFQKGYQKGMLDERLSAMNQQQQEMQDELAAASGMGGTEVSQPDPMEQARERNSQNLEQTGQESSELDASLGELEGLVAKSESMNAKDLRKNLKHLKKKIKETRDVAMLSKSLYKDSSLKEVKDTFKSKVNKPAPRVVNSQHKIVKDMISRWDDASVDVAKKIEDAVKRNEK